jgi:hypothetical protein
VDIVELTVSLINSVDVVIKEPIEILKPIIYTTALINDTNPADNILAVSMDTLEIGVDSKVSKVLSIFSVEIAVTIIWDANTIITKIIIGTKAPCDIIILLIVEALTSAEFSPTTDTSSKVTGLSKNSISSALKFDFSSMTMFLTILDISDMAVV